MWQQLHGFCHHSSLTIKFRKILHQKMKTDKNALTVKHQSEEEKQGRRHLHGAHLQTLWLQVRPESRCASGWDQHFDSQLFCSLFSFHLHDTRAHTRSPDNWRGGGGDEGGAGLGEFWRGVGWGAGGCATPAAVSGEGDMGLFYFERGPLFEPPCWYLQNDSAVCLEIFFALVATIWTKGQLPSNGDIAHTTNRLVYIHVQFSALICPT